MGQHGIRNFLASDSGTLVSDFQHLSKFILKVKYRYRMTAGREGDRSLDQLASMDAVVVRQ